MKTNTNGRWPQNIKIEYLCNHWSDLPQSLNLSLGEQTKIKYCLKWRQPPIEDNLKNLKLDISVTTDQSFLKFSTLAYATKTKLKIVWNEYDLPQRLYGQVYR